MLRAIMSAPTAASRMLHCIRLYAVLGDSRNTGAYVNKRFRNQILPKEHAKSSTEPIVINTWQQPRNYRNPEWFGAFMRVLEGVGRGPRQGVLSDAVDEKILLDYLLGVLFRRVQM